MAKNTGDNYRRGSVDDRSQFQRPDGLWVICFARCRESERT
jgi:hypothetical protein